MVARPRTVAAPAPRRRGAGPPTPTRHTPLFPLIGARKRAQLTEALGALDVRLSPGDIDRIEAAVPAAAVAGTRYDADHMRILDSERPS